MLVQSLPPVAVAYYRQQTREAKAAIRAVLRQWRRVGNDFDAGWSKAGPVITSIVATAQGRMASQGAAYVPAVMPFTGLAGAVEPVARVNPGALAGVTGAGVALDDALRVSIIHAKQRVGEGWTAPQALASVGKWLSSSVGTALSDAGRSGESLAMAVRPKVRTYVRMLTPPSCSRCAILAGTTWHVEDAFERHPKCDCRNIPAAESVADDLTVDKDAYFASMSEAEQNRVFTNAGADAIRNGADMNQVVNARSGMTRAQSGRLIRDSHGLYSTSSGTTRRGLYGGTTGGKRPRLMPESLREIAGKNDAEFRRLLEANKYIF